MKKLMVLLFYGFIISFSISCQKNKNMPLYEFSEFPLEDTCFPTEIQKQEIPNWEYIARILYNSLGDEHIRDIEYKHFINGNNAQLYITLYIYPGYYESFKLDNLDELKIGIQQYLPNYKYSLIRFEIIYPFIIIFKNRIEYDNMKEISMRISYELPFGMGITHLFNNGCFGIMTEFDGRPKDDNEKMNINNVFNKYFGIEYIFEL